MFSTKINVDTKIRIVLVVVSAAIPMLSAALAVHGFVISPLGDPIGPSPH